MSLRVDCGLRVFDVQEGGKGVDCFGDGAMLFKSI